MNIRRSIAIVLISLGGLAVSGCEVPENPPGGDCEWNSCADEYVDDMDGTKDDINT